MYVQIHNTEYYIEIGFLCNRESTQDLIMQ